MRNVDKLRVSWAPLHFHGACPPYVSWRVSKVFTYRMSAQTLTALLSMMPRLLYVLSVMLAIVILFL